MDSKTISEGTKSGHKRSIEKQVKYLEDAARQLKAKMPADEEKALKDEAIKMQKPVRFFKSLINFFSETEEEKKEKGERLKREAYEIKAQKRRRLFLQRKEIELVQSKYNRDEIRVALSGKSGKGKSLLGNNLLKYEAFKSRSSLKGVTQKCKFAMRYLGDGFDLLVIDTPGLFDSHKPNEDVSKEITRCISLAAPGPHIFIFVVSVTRFTPEEADTLINLERIFGEKVVDHVIIVFTNKDNLHNGDIMKFMKKADGFLLDFLVKCNFRFAFINNKADPCDLRVDVDVILDLIFKTIGENNGAYYTSETLRLADQVIGEKIKEKEERKKRNLQQLEEEKKKLLDENPDYKSSQVQIPSSGTERNSEDDGEEFDVPASVISKINRIEKGIDKITTILKQKHADDKVSDIENIKMKIQKLSQLYRESAIVERKYENPIPELKEIKQKLDELLNLIIENPNPRMSHVDEDSKSPLKTIMEKLNKMEDRMNKKEDKGNLTSETGWGSVPVFKQDISNNSVLQSNVDNSKIEERLINIEKKIDSTKNTNTYIEVKKEIEKEDETITNVGRMIKTASAVGAGFAVGVAATAGAPLVAVAVGAAAVGSWISSWWRS